jgi:membrane protease YdiL (CAAX protease family)
MSVDEPSSAGAGEPHVARRASALLGLSFLAALGLASLMAAPVERLVPLDAPALVVRALAIIQPAILAAGAILLGFFLAPRVGLGMPYLSGSQRLDPGSSRFRRDLGLALAVALVAGVLLHGYQIWSTDVLTALNPAAAAEIAGFSPPLVTRLLYGGLTEEIISRWGVMTLFVWLIGRVVARRRPPPPWAYWVAATIAALLFAAGHLPLLFALIASPPVELVAAVLTLNAIVGVAFGWLYWKAGLETAMLAHALTHAVSATLSFLGVATGLA